MRWTYLLAALLLIGQAAAFDVLINDDATSGRVVLAPGDEVRITLEAEPGTVLRHIAIRSETPAVDALIQNSLGEYTAIAIPVTEEFSQTFTLPEELPPLTARLEIVAHYLDEDLQRNTYRRSVTLSTAEDAESSFWMRAVAKLPADAQLVLLEGLTPQATPEMTYLDIPISAAPALGATHEEYALAIARGILPEIALASDATSEETQENVTVRKHLQTYLVRLGEEETELTRILIAAEADTTPVRGNLTVTLPVATRESAIVYGVSHDTPEGVAWQLSIPPRRARETMILVPGRLGPEDVDARLDREPLGLIARIVGWFR